MVDAGAYIEILASGARSLRRSFGFGLRYRVDDRSGRGAPAPTERIPVLPGRHEVAVWNEGRSGKRRYGLARTEVDVPPGWSVRLLYRGAPLLFGSGRLEPAGLSPATLDLRQPAGWYPDPTGRRDRRWWDGAEWTVHVQQDGTTIEDPM